MRKTVSNYELKTVINDSGKCRQERKGNFKMKSIIMRIKNWNIIKTIQNNENNSEIICSVNLSRMHYQENNTKNMEMITCQWMIDQKSHMWIKCREILKIQNKKLSRNLQIETENWIQNMK